MRYAHLDKENKILGWYSDDIHDIIPTPNIEVSDEVWQEAININANCYEDGELIVKDFRTDEELEEARTGNINSCTQSFITTKYPLEKQSSANLGIYSDEYKNEMISFISNCITLSNEAIANNTSFDDYKAMLDEY